MIKEIEWHNSNFIKDRNIKFRLKDIFSDHWDNFIETYSNFDIRPVIHKEVKKMISCRTSDLGYSVYECPDCGEIKFSYHTCNHRYLMALRFSPNSTNDKHLRMYTSDKEPNLYLDISY